MTNVIELRRLELRDLNEIEEIERGSYPTPWSRSMFAGELAKPSSICLGAVDTDRDELVGYLIISRYVDAWHVMNVAVDPACRRRGIGTTLLRQLLAIVGETTQLTLEVRISNGAAIALYEELGFLRAGLRRRYYADNGEDALIMWLD
jgi:ribosomal-protein-alanine N-acetyltransferase